MKNRILALLLAVIMVLSLSACGAASKNDSMEAAPEANRDMASGSLSDAGSLTDSALPENAKIIRTLEIYAETEDLDPLLQEVENRVKELGGYIENKSAYWGSQYNDRSYRNANLTVRIPAEKADTFVEKVGENSNITSTYEDAEDITLQYVATESRIQALETEQKRLLELLEQAENMEDLLLIEQRLTEVRGELETVTSQLKVYDNKVNYTTIHLNIQEVKEYTPVVEETFWQRIGGGFVDSCKGLFEGGKEVIIFLLANLPYLVVIGGAATAVVFAIRAGKKKKKNKEQ